MIKEIYFKIILTMDILDEIIKWIKNKEKIEIDKLKNETIKEIINEYWDRVFNITYTKTHVKYMISWEKAPYVVRF